MFGSSFYLKEVKASQNNISQFSVREHRDGNSPQIADKASCRVRAGIFLAPTVASLMGMFIDKAYRRWLGWLYLPSYEIFPALFWEPYHHRTSWKSIRLHSLCSGIYFLIDRLTWPIFSSCLWTFSLPAGSLLLKREVERRYILGRRFSSCPWRITTCKRTVKQL